MTPRAKKQKISETRSSASPSKTRNTLDFFLKKPKDASGDNDHWKNVQIKETEVQLLKAEEDVESDEALARRLQQEFDAEMQTDAAADENEVTQDAGADLDLSLPSAEIIDSNGTAEEPAAAAPTDHEFYDYIDSLDFSTESPVFPLDTHKSFLSSHHSKSSPYALLSRLFVQLTSTRSRLKILNILTNYLRLLLALDKDSLLPSIWLCTNSLGPQYDSPDLGIGWSLVTKCLRNVSGISPASLKSLYDKHGDLGDVAFEAKISVRTIAAPPRLTIAGVYRTLLQICDAKGAKSQEIKRKLVERLLISARGEEVRYLTRTFVQNLRVGAVKTTMLVSLARAFTYSSTPACLPADQLKAKLARSEKILRQVYVRHPNYNDIVSSLLRCSSTDDLGIEELPALCPMQLHVPVLPMLGSITRDMADLYSKLSLNTSSAPTTSASTDDKKRGVEFTCEFKYDGQRAQVHFDKQTGKVSIFSRNLENMTEKYPDIVALFTSASTVLPPTTTSFIIEGEIVAIDSVTHAIQSFQTLSNRTRKAVSLSEISIKVCLFAFDVMYFNHASLLERPFRERRGILYSALRVGESEGRLAFAEHLDAGIDDVEGGAVSEFFKRAVGSKCEGIMVKLLDSAKIEGSQPDDDEEDAADVNEDVTIESTEQQLTTSSRRKILQSTYTPDIRHESWLKVKKDYSTSTTTSTAADSLDLIPIGGWHGQGRKARFWSPILLAVRDADSGTLTAVCKCMSGFTDARYKEMKDKYAEDGPNTLSGYRSGGEGRTVPTGWDVESPLVPDVWFVPQEVWEIKFADITASPVYTASQGLLLDTDRGLSIRFPRFIRIRDDKSLEEASTPEFLAQLYIRQQTRSVPSADVAAAAADEDDAAQHGADVANGLVDDANDYEDDEEEDLYT
ncbi:putative DNA ligase I [Myxozyma melibiosi]|uniref:DNA ligase n=1 Tax=Myxozyma melibiosi TaxID=54550 RepID=A0ABR1EZC0_9ASCO